MLIGFSKFYSNSIGLYGIAFVVSSTFGAEYELPIKSLGLSLKFLNPFKKSFLFIILLE